MKRIDVVKKRDGWAGESGGRTVPSTKAATKAEAVKKVAAVAKERFTASVRPDSQDGRQDSGGTHLPAVCGPPQEQGLERSQAIPPARRARSSAACWWLPSGGCARLRHPE